MSEPFDEYVDRFTVSVNPYGATLNFQRSPGRVIVGQDAGIIEVGTLRMSLEHTKSMAYLMVKTIKDFEQRSGANPTTPVAVLAQIGVAPEDWAQFWKLEE